MTGQGSEQWPRVEVFFDTTKKKTRAHAKRIQRNLTGKREYPNEVKQYEGKWDGTHNIKHDNRAEAMIGPFKWDLVNASKGHGFSLSIWELTRSSLRTNSGRD